MTQDNPHLGRYSTTTGSHLGASRTAEDLADRAWLRQLGLDVEAKTPAHRCQVQKVQGFAFAVWCKTCSALPTPRGASKSELEALAREHEEAHA